MEEQKNNWDRANSQGDNINFNADEQNERFLKEDDNIEEEINPSKDADGYGSESGRSDHSHYSSGMGGRAGNNDDNPGQYGTRSHENMGGSTHGSSGRGSGNMETMPD